MERFTLSPTTREIIVNRAADAADDLFAYGPETKAQARSLGHLYVVGHTDHESETVGYLVSLVAAMAKREYYATQPAGDAKEAFARMLRKVNEVVEEFFKTNEVGVNVGIFAIAGNAMYVSRLGKFRILLSRDDKVVDVLKDVSQFSKEVVQKKRFSSIISGPVQASDRFLAYFPHLGITRREKTIKASIGLAPDELNDRITEFGKKSSKFSASVLVIDIDQVPAEPEPEVVPPADPQAAPRLAWSPRQGAPAQKATAAVTVDSAAKGSQEGETGDWGDENTEETPNIIPAEFSHRSRSNSVSRALQSARMRHLGSRGKAVVLALVALVVAGGAIGFKSYFFTDEAALQLEQALNDASSQLDQARSLLAQDDTRGARSLILGQLEDLRGLAAEADSENAENLYGSFVATLNEIDRAEPAQVTLVATIPESEGMPIMATAASGSGTVTVLAQAPDEGSALLLTIQDGEVSDSVALEGLYDLMIPTPESVLLANTSARAITVVGAPSEEVILPTPDRILSADWFLDYAYVLTTSGVLRVSDLDTKKPVSKQWLEDVSELAPDALHVAVDGDLWTLSEDGTLTKYFRGEKVEAVQLPLDVSSAHQLLTDEDMPFLYITDAKLKRVHVVDKENIQLIQTVTIETEQDINDFYMTSDYSIYMLASDGKIWRVE